MAEIESMPLGIGEHPDWRLWPEKGRYPTIKGERWMLCTDGFYFVSLDRPAMLIAVESTCLVCGCPLHPARPIKQRRDRCLAHQDADHDGHEDDERGERREKGLLG